MYFRSRRKFQGEVSLSDTLDNDGEGNNLSLMDIIRVGDTMPDKLDVKESCRKVQKVPNGTVLAKGPANLLQTMSGES